MGTCCGVKYNSQEKCHGAGLENITDHGKYMLLLQWNNRELEMEVEIANNYNEGKLVLDGYLREHIMRNVDNIPLDVLNLMIDFYGFIKSNLKSVDNPLTISRIKRIEMGMAPKVHFDENIVIVPIPDFQMWKMGTFVS